MTTGNIVCILYARCWDCQFQQCPGGPHTWMDSDDAEMKYGESIYHDLSVLASRHPCPCRCYKEPKTAYRWRQAQRARRANPTRLQRMRSEYRRRRSA